MSGVQPPDSSLPSPERQAELKDLYERQKAMEAQYSEIEIRTLGELLWFIQHRQGLTNSSHTKIDHRPDLRGADLNGLSLFGINLYRADLSLANISGSNFWEKPNGGGFSGGASLHSLILQEANLSMSKLFGANLSRANLSNANLDGAELYSANLNEAILQGATLSGATFSSTVLTNVDLRSVQGLETIYHSGPSMLGIDTLYKSHGQIPDVFLRGCGLPDEMIAFVHSIAGSIQFYSAFISYNHQDDAFATRLYNDLQANNIRCWKYTENVKIGDEILSRVDEAIRFHDKLLLIISAASLKSGWVKREVLMALDCEERTQRMVLFPVCIDDTIHSSTAPWAATLRTRNIGNFANWKDQDQYQPMFERLLRDLKQS